MVDILIYTITKVLKKLIYEEHTISYQTFFVWALKITVDS